MGEGTKKLSGREGGRGMEKNGNLGASVRMVFPMDLSLEPLHYPFYRGETQARSPFLGGKKRGEEMGKCLFAKSLSRILDSDFYHFLPRFR
jgi:hypothetical protein